MKKNLPLFFFFLLSVANGFTQSTKFFAVTGDTYGSVNWIAFRQFDLSDNTAERTLYVPAQTSEVVYSALTNEAIADNNDAVKSNPQQCGCMNNKMVAAIAFDAVNNRLYYTTMMGNQLRYLDLASDKPKSYAITTQLLKNFKDQPGEASIVTRMCFAADGFGYALTNDNQHLIRFTTKKQSDITDLGALTDAKTNGEHSINVQFKSWGGDMIADANGGLYLFTIQRGVFKINLATKVATYLGDIQNIPSEYTVNGAMVEDDAKVIVASSTNTSTYYRVDLNTLQATAFSNNENKMYNVSDFANANLAFGSKNLSVITPKKSGKIPSVKIYPNPVTNKNFALNFSNAATGKYSILVSEVGGKSIMQKDINLSGSQTVKFNLPASTAAGAYIVKVINDNADEVYSSKIIVD